jgi:hypothetical protein
MNAHPRCLKPSNYQSVTPIEATGIAVFLVLHKLILSVNAESIYLKRSKTKEAADEFR